MKNKYIFCDINGVLIPYKGKESDHRCFNWIDRWDENAMEYLNKILDETGAELIISSNFRRVKTKSQIQEKFDEAGFEHEIHSLLPYPKLKRGSAIHLFLKKFNDDVKFVIIDDKDHDILNWYEDEFIKTKSDKCITKKDAESAIEILNK